MADREQAERNEEQRQEDDVAAAQGKHDQRYGYAEGEDAQHVAFLLVVPAAWRGTLIPPVPRARFRLPVAANRLVGIAHARQVVAC